MTKEIVIYYNEQFGDFESEGRIIINLEAYIKTCLKNNKVPIFKTIKGN